MGANVGESRSEQNFREADNLYRQGQYQEALTLLVELDRAHPNTRRILYPMALCLSKLEQHSEAMRITARLVAEFEYGPARKLHAKLQESLEPIGVTGLEELDLGLSGASGFGLTAASTVGPPVIAMESFTSKYFNSILVAVFTVTLAVLIFFQNRIGFELTEWLEAVGQQPETLPPFPVASAVYNVALTLLLSFFGGCVGAYCGLAVVQALPEDDFNDNLKDIALYVLYGTLLSFIPILGWIAILVVIYRHYELRFGSLIVTVFVYVIIGSVVTYGLAFSIGLASELLPL